MPEIHYCLLIDDTWNPDEWFKKIQALGIDAEITDIGVLIFPEATPLSVEEDIEIFKKELEQWDE